MAEIEIASEKNFEGLNFARTVQTGRKNQLTEITAN